VGHYDRSGTALLGLLSSGSRGLGMVRSDTGLLGLKATATRSLAITRAKTALLGLKGIASRTIGLVRSKIALLGLKATGVAALPSVPTANAQAATNIGENAARINGKITDDGQSSCEARFRWRKKGNLDLRIAANLDDAYEENQSGTMFCGGSEILMRSGLGANADWAGFRFPSGSLPPLGSTITSCYLKFYVKNTASDDINGNFHFQKVASPAAFTSTDFDITDRTRTTNSISWIEDSLGVGWAQTASLVTALQEVIDSYSPTALVVIFRPNIEDNVKECAVYSNEGDPIQHRTAILHIEWEEAWTETSWQNTLETNDTYYEDLTSLDGFTKYEFQTQARNSQGTGDWSSSLYFRTKLVQTATAYLGLLGTGSRTIGLSRAKTALLGLLATGSRTIALSRANTALLGLKATGVYSTLGHYIRTGVAYLGLLATGSRALALSRSNTALLGLKGIGSRLLALTRANKALLGLKAVGTRFRGYTRTGTAILGLKATGIMVRAGVKLVVKVVTSQYRNIQVQTSQHRLVKVITSQYRKIRALLLGE